MAFILVAGPLAPSLPGGNGYQKLEAQLTSRITKSEYEVSRN